MRVQPTEVPQSETKGKDSARPLESENTTKAESMIKPEVQLDSPRFNLEEDEPMIDEEKKVDVQSDQEMTESIQDSLSESLE